MGQPTGNQNLELSPLTDVEASTTSGLSKVVPVLEANKPEHIEKEVEISIEAQIMHEKPNSEQSGGEFKNEK